MAAWSPSDISIQERFYPNMTCFGCGPANSKGLRLRSFAVDDDVVAVFLPGPEHDNGLGFLNGGIICTVLDCHSAAAVVSIAEQRSWTTQAGAGYVTAGLEVAFRRPTPLDVPLELRARVTMASQGEMHVEAELSWDGKVRADARSVWKPSRARPHGSRPTVAEGTST